MLNCLKVQIEALESDPHPGHVLIALKLGEQRLLSRITERSRRELALKPEDTVYALVKGVAVH